MKMKLQCTWRQASNATFKPDHVRANSTVFRPERLTCVVQHNNENSIEVLKNWLMENQVKQYTMFSIYDVRRNKNKDVYYHGLAFEFTTDSDAILFKLSFM
jgi:hypothetical protein